MVRLPLGHRIGLTKSVYDLNITESVWKELRRRVADKYAKYLAQKFLRIKQEWSKIPQSFTDALLDSIPRRFQAVIDANLFPAKY